MGYKKMGLLLGSLSSLIVVSILFQNCAKRGISNSGETVSAQTILQSKSMDLLSQKCSACHSGDNAYANVVPGSDPITDIANADYLLKARLIVPGEPDLSPLYQMVSSADMPPGQPLSADEMNLLKEWIANFNKADTPTGGGIITTPLAPNFTSLRVNVFLNKCFTCHTNRAIKLDSYTSVSGAIMNNTLRDRVNNNTMPPTNAPQLSAQEKMYLLQWIDAGALNN